MRVGVVGPVAPDFFADNIGDALERTGHVVTYLGAAHSRFRNRLATGGAALARQALPRLNERSQRSIAEAALEAQCEVVINVDVHLVPGVVARLKHAGIPVAFWFPDHVALMGRQMMLLAPYDVLFFKDSHIVDHLRAMLDLPVFYLPQACNPRWHRPLVPAATEPYLVIAGNMHPARVRVLERLIGKGIPVRLYGGAIPRWLPESPIRDAHTGRTILREEKAKIFRSAAGVLNTMQLGEVTGVNSRLFEAAGCGAAVLTEFRPTVPELFDVGAEVLAYHDFDELLDLATRVLNDAGLSSRLGDAAARRAHRDHIYDLRVATILEKLA
jgi:spore maturation protein CgeB